MDFKDYTNLFCVITLSIALIVAFPLFDIITPFQDNSERFSELYLLGPDHTTKNLPFNVSADETYNVFVGVNNNMGNSEYYLISVKFGNVVNSFSDITSKPSSLFPLYEFRFFVDNGEAWESVVSFGLQNVSVQGDILSVSAVVVNGVVFPVDFSTPWDYENEGFYSQVFFELLDYDVDAKAFSSDDKFVGFWLKLEP